MAFPTSSGAEMQHTNPYQTQAVNYQHPEVVVQQQPAWGAPNQAPQMVQAMPGPQPTKKSNTSKVILLSLLGVVVVAIAAFAVIFATTDREAAVANRVVELIEAQDTDGLELQLGSGAVSSLSEVLVAANGGDYVLAQELQVADSRRFLYQNQAAVGANNLRIDMTLNSATQKYDIIVLVGEQLALNTESSQFRFDAQPNPASPTTVLENESTPSISPSEPTTSGGNISEATVLANSMRDLIQSSDSASIMELLPAIDVALLNSVLTATAGGNYQLVDSQTQFIEDSQQTDYTFNYANSGVSGSQALIVTVSYKNGTLSSLRFNAV